MAKQDESSAHRMTRVADQLADLPRHAASYKQGVESMPLLSPHIPEYCHEFSLSATSREEEELNRGGTLLLSETSSMAKTLGFLDHRGLVAGRLPDLMPTLAFLPGRRAADGEPVGMSRPLTASMGYPTPISPPPKYSQATSDTDSPQTAETLEPMRRDGDWSYVEAQTREAGSQTTILPDESWEECQCSLLLVIVLTGVTAMISWRACSLLSAS
ncbi:hypothetical protein DCS_00997 [Drechmeria coniospora]|uniref:Uncharacterized protein n=1 Tax=Drechmeria coniospora TaxID=98403 RepID=A0A151GS14_DRECN|nr:hypothetical protein DCS_00997 [Drechmeria coniospora]KYK59863.1 hypothetical protein DCS_00997 [Drechmeria coniospora]